EGVSRFFVLLFLQIQIAEFLVVSRRRVVDNLRFQSLNPRTPAEALEYARQQPHIGERFDQEIGTGADGSSDQNDPEPVAFRPALHEVNDRQDLQDDSPRIKEVTQVIGSVVSGPQSSLAAGTPVPSLMNSTSLPARVSIADGFCGS